MPTRPPVLDEHPVWSIDPRRPDSPPVGGYSPLHREWVLTNGVGGYAMGTVAGTPTRRYHGLLVAALEPPVARVLMLAAMDEVVVLDPDGRAAPFRLTPFHFATAETRPALNPYLIRFDKDDGARWTFELPGPGGRPITIRKSLDLGDGVNAARLRYELPEGVDARLELRPLVALRDFHSLLTGHEPDITARESPAPAGCAGVVVARRDVELRLSARGVEHFDHEPMPWRSIDLPAERDRGMNDHEDWFCPGVFVARGPGEVEVVATAGAASAPEDWASQRDIRRRRRRAMIDTVLGSTRHGGDARARTRLAQLAAGADDFIVRAGDGARGRASVIAGYPWFADWGRDTMIALPGLFLATGRLDEAYEVLLTFAGAQRRGLIPNRFDDHAGPAHYNTADASLWFVHAACQWLDAAGDRARFNGRVRPACERVVRAYLDGADFNIRVDPADGLVCAGTPDTQLTWMDAKREGVVFTPRHGKPVEINALWVHALRSLAIAVAPDDAPLARELEAHAARAARSFRESFLGGPLGGLTDCLVPESNTRAVRWSRSRELRPNQVFAAGLEHAPLDPGERRAVVRVVRDHLLTPAGLRTLAPSDPGYRPAYRGPLFERDCAYHNGTVWPWLLGPFCEALMRGEGFSGESRAEAAERLLVLADAMDGPSIGQLVEVADAEAGPDGRHRFDGCMAQAWSVSETLRVLTMALSGR